MQGAPTTSGQTKGKGKGKTAESRADCFFCKKRGHWKRNCPQYLATLDPNRPSKKKKQHGAADAGIYMINPCNFS